jgi:predicted AlkP superfamily pyrophosphatase or phosphodiesterase
MSEYSLTQLAPTIAAALGVPAPNGCRQDASAPAAIPEIVADLQDAARLAVVAPDALGMHPFGLWRHEMPFLDGLHRRHSLVLRAVMPTITPVNFSTMVAGTDLAGHGMQSRESDFQCETLFDVVRAHGGQSAGVGRIGYTGSKILARFADLQGTAASDTDAEVEQITLSFARDRLPQFIIVQLGSTDDVFHKHGPSSPEVLPVVRETDERLRRMVTELTGLGYAVIITSDHGQHDCDRGGTHGSEADEDALVPCTWVTPAG